MADESESYKGSRFEMALIGSGWLKETKTRRKYQRFVINNAVELKKDDVLCVYLAKSKRTDKSPQYYIFHDIKARDLPKKPRGDDDYESRDKDDPDNF